MKVNDDPLEHPRFPECGHKDLHEESPVVNAAIAKQYDAILWRNHAGGDPDTQYVWWHCNTASPAPCDNPLNFDGFNDAVINRALDDGRTNADPNARRADCEKINKEFASQLWNLWDQRLLWTVAYQLHVRGILGPDLPDGTGPWPGLASGHSVAGLWISH